MIRRLRLVRPRWTLGTMLLVVGWSSLVVWLNVRPRVKYIRNQWESVVVSECEYGCPWTYASDFDLLASSPHRFRLTDGVFTHDIIHDTWNWPLAGNIAIGLLAVAVLTFASKYLVRAIVAGLRAFVGKPPPDTKEGPSKSQ